MLLMTFWVTVGVAHRNSPRLAIERVDDAGLAGDAGQHPADLSRLDPRVDPAHLGRVGRDRGVHEDALEGMVEIPVVVQVLVVPESDVY